MQNLEFLIDFYALTTRKKTHFKLGSSLANVEFQELSHLTRGLSQAEKIINNVTNANAQNNIYFTQNGQSCHFE